MKLEHYSPEELLHTLREQITEAGRLAARLERSFEPASDSFRGQVMAYAHVLSMLDDISNGK